MSVTSNANQPRPVALISSFRVTGRINIIHPSMEADDVKALVTAILPNGLTLANEEGEDDYTMRRLDDNEPIKDAWITSNDGPSAVASFFSREDQNLPAWLLSARAQWWDLDSIRAAMIELTSIAKRHTIDLSLDAAYLVDPAVEVLQLHGRLRHERPIAKRDEFLREVGVKIFPQTSPFYWHGRRLAFSFVS